MNNQQAPISRVIKRRKGTFGKTPTTNNQQPTTNNQQPKWLKAIAIGVLSVIVALPGMAQPLDDTRTCPGDAETLMALMLRDLPSYANRVLRRSRILDNPDDDYDRSIFLAGRPEFQPLSLSPIAVSQVGDIDPSEPPQQVFFTTLETIQHQDRLYRVQSYYWLFLSETEVGWRLSLLYARLGSANEERTALPPRENSNGIVGQAVKLWLRDCRNNAIRR
ncbi:MAG: hypothetical protein SAJ12_19125 [Jaaginema sp. PMC 1079.18]|nr:hypothetical protein [Jaaginema sp. PMC 1080.18]MEC4853100.1 hypothetical protein [Jaaginema sp. PMC 1079.18]MEC4867071.1 hypothetical protein [Jaaginema sp. PMC 1078.18]